MAGVSSGNLTITGIVCRLPGPSVTCSLVNDIVTSRFSLIPESIISSELNLNESIPFPGFSSLIITNISSSTSTS